MSIYIGNKKYTPYYGTRKAGRVYCGTRLVYGAKKSRLPFEYQEVEYIESTGTQYIDTGYRPNPDTAFELELKFGGDFKASQTNGVFFGETEKVTDGNTYFFMNFGSNPSQYNLLFTWFNKSGDGIRSLNIDDLTRTNRNKIKYSNGNVIYANFSRSTIEKTTTSSIPMYLFARNYNGGVRPFVSYNMYVYSFQLSENNVLMRNFVPCYRKSDDEIGLYDLVEGKFYINQGSGEFLKGGNV